MKVNKLPDEYAELAFQRMREDKLPDYKPSNDLQKAFLWWPTPEGDRFWTDVNRVHSISELPPIPGKEAKSIGARSKIIIGGREYKIELIPIEETK